MNAFFLAMVYVTSIIAMAVTLGFFVGIMLNNESMSNGQVFDSCSAQLKVCRVTSLIFTVIYCFCVSGLSEKKCLAGYATLSKTCSRIGCIWIIFAVLDIAISIVMIIVKKNSEAMDTMAKLRKPCFLMGAVFLLISFILKVG